MKILFTFDKNVILEVEIVEAPESFEASMVEDALTSYLEAVNFTDDDYEELISIIMNSFTEVKWKFNPLYIINV